MRATASFSNCSFHRRLQIVEKCLSGIILVVAVVTPDVGVADVSPRQTTLIEVIDRLAASVPLNPALIERVTGAKLTPMPADEGVRTYESHDLKLRDATIGVISYNEPIARGGSDDVAHLSMSIWNVCISESEIRSRYSPSDFSSPSHDVPGAPIYDIKIEPWGKIAFKFVVGGPDCLQSVTFRAKLS